MKGRSNSPHVYLYRARIVRRWQTFERGASPAIPSYRTAASTAIRTLQSENVAAGGPSDRWEIAAIVGLFKRRVLAPFGSQTLFFSRQRKHLSLFRGCRGSNATFSLRSSIAHGGYGDVFYTTLAEVRVSRTHRRPLRTTTGFEDREDHRSLSTSWTAMTSSTEDMRLTYYAI